jgi:ABC-2 type transport system permease protein
MTHPATSPTFFNLTLPGLRSIFRKEIIQLLRDPYLVAFIVTLPILQLLVTGLAIQRDLRHIPTLVYNYDNRNPSLELLKSFEHSEYFDLRIQQPSRTSEAETLQQVREGRIAISLVIPPEYSEKLLSGVEPAPVQLTVDGTNATIAKSILEAAQAVVANHNAQYLSNTLLARPSDGQTALPGDTPATPPVTLQTKKLNNESLSSAVFLIPGILAIIMHMMTVLFTSFSIVRERETGTLEQLMVSPIRVADLMVGKVIPYAVIGLLDMLLTLGVMVTFFHIPISGSFWFLLAASVLFIFTSLGIGLLISTTCRSQVQAIQLTVGLLLPALLLSGFVFPIKPMPLVIKAISYAMPLTYYLEIIRGVVIQGIGAPELWRQTAVLAFICAIMVAASIIRFKKQVA